MKISFEKKRRLTGYVFTAPFIIGFGILMLIPLIMTLVMSLGEIYDIVGLKTRLIGFDNYIKLFTEDVSFVPAFLNTIKISFLWTPFVVVFALFIAILLNKDIKGKGIFRVIFFLPVLLGSGYIMSQLDGATNILKMPTQMEEFIAYYFNPSIADFINQLLGQIMNVFWKTGVQILLFLSGLQSIPDSYYEAARVDNANSWDCFWKITLPMISPIVLLNVVYTMIDSFRDTNNEIGALIVSVGFDNANYEYGSAMGWVFFAVIGLFTGLVFLLSRRLVTYDK